MFFFIPSPKTINKKRTFLSFFLSFLWKEIQTMKGIYNKKKRKKKTEPGDYKRKFIFTLFILKNHLKQHANYRTTISCSLLLWTQKNCIPKKKKKTNCFSHFIKWMAIRMYVHPIPICVWFFQRTFFFFLYKM